MKQVILYMFILLTAAACSSSEEDMQNNSNEVEVSFQLTLSETNVVVTRSSSSLGDNSIRNLDLLIFDHNEKFQQRISVNAVDGEGVNKTFKVRMPSTSNPVTVYFVANGRDENNIDVLNFSALTAGISESEAVSLLQSNPLADGSAPTLPLLMSGKAKLESVTASSTFTKVDLVRSVASIKVTVDPTLDVALGDRFKLLGFSLLKSSDRAQVLSSTDLGLNLAVPNNVRYVDYVNDQIQGAWSTTSDIYLYERSNVLGNNGLSVIIYAKYDGIEGYYKLWLKDGGDKAMDIIRNHRYLINITKVFGVGYQTLNEAISADHASNIFAEIVDDNNDISDIIVDGKYMLGLSSNSIETATSGPIKLGIVLSTNPNVELKGTTLAPWITNIRFIGSDSRRVIMADLAPFPYFYRRAVVTIRAGSLTRKIDIIQYP